MTSADDALYRDTMQRFLRFYRYVRGYAREMHAEGISGRKVSTLRYLVDSGPLTVGQLSEYLCISDSSTSGLLASLEESGYVTRTRSRADQRVVLVSLTSEGHALIGRTPLGGIPLLREAFKALPEDRLYCIRDAFTTINDLLGIADDR